MFTETWQIILLTVGGGVWIVFEILSIIKNRKAKKAKKAAAKSFCIDPNPEEEKRGGSE